MPIYNQKLQIITNFAVILAVIADLFFPKVATADSQIPNVIYSESQKIQNSASTAPQNRLTRAEDSKPRKVIYVTVTAYSSTPDQCDNSPFITASGTRVHDGTLAANFLPFGTKVRFPEYFGDKIFTVEDRMHPRFFYRADIWMETREMAKKFGIKKLKMEIY